MPAEDEVDCVVPGGVSVSKAYENRGDRCIVNNYALQHYCITSLHPLGYHLATSEIKDMIKGTLLCDVKLILP